MKYKRLLEGLEVSEVKLSELQKTSVFRYDAEFFNPQILRLNTQIDKHNKILLANAEIKFGTTPKGANFQTTGVPFVRSQDFSSGFVNYHDCVHITQQEHESQYASCVKDKDILIAAVGATIGQIGIVKGQCEANTNQNIARVRITKKEILPEYLFAFMRGKYGQCQLLKLNTGNAQAYLNSLNISEIKVPILSFEFQIKVKEKIDKAHTNRERSQHLYHKAEELLLETIGLKEFKPNETGTNIKSLKESFLKTGRLDAEYYQRKYEDVIDLVKNQDYDLLGNLVGIRKSIEPGSDVYSDEGLPFIRVSDYNKFGISAPAKYLSDKYFKENKQQLTALFPKKETILFSKDGSVGTAYLIQNDMQAVTSGALLHLTVKNKTNILPEYLTLVLNSEVIQKQAERDAGGSVILHWRTSEIENVVVPIVPYQKTQHHLATLIQESFALRTASERLLAEAKEMVEREIEKY